MFKQSILPALLLTGSLLSATVSAQTSVTSARSFGSVKIAAASKIDTRSFNPQISTFYGKKPKISENPMIMPWRKTGTKNSLVAGQQNNNLSIVGEPKIAFEGIGFTGFLPPDPDVAVGPNHVVLAVNTSLAFYEKATGRKTFEQTYEQFFNSLGITGEVISDPKVIYDPVSRRWFTLIIEVGFTGTFSNQLVAVSDDADPNGTWFRYKIDSELTVDNTQYWLDYPGFGCNKDTVVITGNMFGYTSGFFGNMFLVLPKAPLLTGAAVTGQKFGDPTSSTTKVCISSDPNSDVVYAISDNSTSTVKVHAVTGGATASPQVRSTTVTVPNFNYFANGIITTSNGSVLDGFDGRLFNATFRNGSILAAHGVQVSSADTRQKVRWYEVRTNNWPLSGSQPTLRQSGDIVGAAGEHTHMPAINMNSRNEVSVVYSRTSNAATADLVYAARRANDPLGTVGRPNIIARSTIAYPFYRWGDYFGLAIDPVDDRTFWGYGMVASGTAWTTFVQSWRIPSNGEGAVPYNATSANVFANQGTFVSGTATSLHAVDNNIYRANSLRVNGLGQVTALEANYTTAVRPTTAQYLGVNVRASGPSTSTTQVYLWNYTTGRYDLIRSYATGTSTQRTDVAEAIAGRYVSSTGAARVMVRVLDPVKIGQMPRTFTLGADQIQFLGEVKVAL
ncbi:MAG: hypothetical protein SFX74_09750 [Fimbriimonadaceae bacterium]|nr:hypothetical protein [Fimbriimonadaceae bacterium]